MKKWIPIVTLFYLLFSIPALSQNTRKPFYVQLSYGQSFFSSDASPSYTFICPEAKLGLGYIKEWNRVGISTAIIVGIRFSTTKDFPYQMYIDEAKLYMLMQERSYSSDAEFLEIPLTMHYYLIEDKLSIHAGLSARRYLVNVPASNFQGYLEGIHIDQYNVGILSMLKFNVNRHIGGSIDYFMGLKKLNATTSLNSNKEYHLRGNFAQISLFIKPFNFKK